MAYPRLGGGTNAWRTPWILGVLVCGACKVDAGQSPQLAPHCAANDADVTCQQSYRDRPYCNLCVDVERFQGCVVSPPPPACSPDPSLTDSGMPASDTSAGASSSGDGSSGIPVDGTMGGTTGRTSSSTGADFVCNEEGLLDEDCQALDPAQPYCVDAQCVGCVEAGADAFCLGVEPALPACDASTNTCVACDLAGPDFCQGVTPVCAPTGACLACDAHAECPTGACHIAPDDPLHGQCFAASDPVIYVDAGAICPGLGTLASPSCSLAQSLAALDVGTSVIVHVAGGTDYAEAASFAGATVALLGDGVPALVGDAMENLPSLSVGAGAVAYLQAIRIAGNPSSHGVDCSGGVLWLEQAESRDNAGYGVHTTGPCQVTLRRASAHGNAGGGIRMLGGTLTLDNAAVGVNGDGGGGPGVNLQYATVDMLYSTIAGNAGAGPDSLQCLEAVGTVRNSILTGVTTNSIDLDCFTLDYTTNAVDTPTFAGGEGVAVGAFTDAWFADPAAGDFRLLNPPFTPFGEVAQWQSGDPAADADGTTRPIATLGYAGVDEP